VKNGQFDFVVILRIYVGPHIADMRESLLIMLSIKLGCDLPSKDQNPLLLWDTSKQRREKKSS